MAFRILIGLAALALSAGLQAQTQPIRIGAFLSVSGPAAFRKRGVTKVRTLLSRDNGLVLAFFRSQGLMAAPFIALERDL